LSSLFRFIGACVLFMPYCVRVVQIFTGVCVLASLGFVYGVGVCKTALDSSGTATFFAAAKTLVLASTVVWTAACFGGPMRRRCLPDPALSRPESTRVAAPPESPCSAKAVCQNLYNLFVTYGP
jgi:hypothetical protein